MKNLILLILTLLTGVVSAQKLDTIFNGYLSPIVQTGGSSPNFTFTGAFHNDLGTFDGSEVTTDAVLIMESDGNCYELPITTLTATGTVISGTVNDASAELATLPAGTAAIVRKTSVKGLYPIPAGLPQSTEGCVHTVNMIILDTISASSNDIFFYHVAANNEDYSLPIDTLDKYSRFYITLYSTTSSRLTLPSLSGTNYTGKYIEVRYSSGPSGIVSVGSTSNIFTYNCAGYDIDEGPMTSDTLTTGLKDRVRYDIYSTVYLRHCTPINTVDVTPADTTTFVVYAPAHGLTDSISTYGYVPIKTDYTKANSSSIDSVHFAYAVGAPHVDTLELKLSGAITFAHSLTQGALYYLQDDGTEATTAGTVRAPTVIVLDANTILLSEVGADADQVISRQAIPSPVITLLGGDPQNPSDTVVQIAVSTIFKPAGLAPPGTIFFTTYTTQSKNPTYQENSPTNQPLTPAFSWLWDGAYVTRMSYLLTSVDMQATSAGLFTLDTVQLVNGVPNDSTAAVWLEDNYVNNNLTLPNGAIIYWKGDGTATSPDYSWVVIDDITNTTEANDYLRILKRVKNGSSIDSVYTSSDTLFIATPDTALFTILPSAQFITVVSQEYGDNTTAERNNPSKPFADPWAAAAAAQSNDFILVLAGNYTACTSGCNSTTTNLWVTDSINYHFVQGAKIDLINTSTALFTKTTAGFNHLRVTGSGEFDMSLNSKIIDININSLSSIIRNDLYFEANRVDSCNIRTRGQVLNATLKIKEAYTIDTYPFYFQGGNNYVAANGINYQVEIGRIVTLDSPVQLFRFGNYYNSNYQINIGRLEVTSDGNGSNGGVLWGPAINIDDLSADSTIIEFNIGYLKHRRADTTYQNPKAIPAALVQGEYFSNARYDYWSFRLNIDVYDGQAAMMDKPFKSIDGEPDNKSDVHFNIGRGYMSNGVPLWSDLNTESEDSYQYVKLHCNYCTSDTLLLYIGEFTGGTYKAKQMDVSGNYETSGLGPVLSMGNDMDTSIMKVVFRDATMKTAGDTTIESTSSSSAIFAMGLFDQDAIKEGANVTVIRLPEYGATSGGGSGTVTSVASGFGLDGGPITTAGTLSVDTAEIATQYDLAQSVDSTRLTQDSILVYYQGGVEVGRDTIAIPSGGTTLPTGEDGALWRDSSGVAVQTPYAKINAGGFIDIGTPATTNIAPLNVETSSNKAIVIRRENNTTSGGQLLWSTAAPAGFQITATSGDGIHFNSSTNLGSTAAAATTWTMKTTGLAYGDFSPNYALDLSNFTDGARVAVGTTAQQPTGANGVLRYNSTTSAFEGYSNAAYRAFYQESTADPTAILGYVGVGLAGDITVGERLSLSSGQLDISQRWCNMRKASANIYAFSTTPEQIDTLDGSTSGGLFSVGATGVATYSNTANRTYQISWQVTFSSSEADKEVSFEVYEAGAASVYNKATQYAATANKKYSVSGLYTHTANDTDTFDIRGYLDSGTANITIHNISIVFTEM